MKRSGFTLLEVIVAITVAGLIALAARAALLGGLDTDERLRRHSARTEGDARFRSLVAQALRHLADAPAPLEPPFVVRDTVLPDGTRSHTVDFYTRGFADPAGSGYAQRVRLAPSEGGGLTIVAPATPDAPSLFGVAGGLVAVNVQARRRGDGHWLGDWPGGTQRPAAVVLAFATVDGSPISPLVVHALLEERP
ncbi:MAG: PulJ/GspJ family protein [Gemmatimonadaceae bacterium]